MVFLTSCWFIIERVIIPDGFKKWFYLSFFIHPLILFFCQIFLWLKLFIEYLFAVLVFPFRIIYGFCLYIFGHFRKCIIFFSSFIRLKRAEVEEEVEQYYDTQPSVNWNQIAYSYAMSSASTFRCKMKLLEFEEDVFEETIDFVGDSLLCEDEKMGESVLYLCDVSTRKEHSFCSSNSFTSSDSSNECLPQIQRDYDEDSDLYMDENMEETMLYPSEEHLLCISKSFIREEYPSEPVPFCASNSEDKYPYTNEYSPTVYSSNFQLVEREVIAEEDKEESDGFYKMYTERMRWFDVLNYERTCGISAIQDKQLVASSPFKSVEPLDSGVVHMSWSKMTKRRLLRSLESDFEMVYVAQLCLSWEALNHQYRKVKELEFCISKNNTYCSNLAGEFQKFQILLERFMEDEQTSEGKRVQNYVQGRFSPKSLLQVPDVSVKGFVENGKEEMKGEVTNLNLVLKAIEECIQAFSVFVETDNSKKSWWKIRISSWTYPPVEDPRDLELLAELTRRLKKNKLWMKDLEGKKRCLLKRIVNPLEESQRKEMLFTMIDMNLVSRVLQMSMISSSQLKWCQEKLDNLEFKDGKVVRAFTESLFPP